MTQSPWRQKHSTAEPPYEPCNMSEHATNGPPARPKNVNKKPHRTQLAKMLHFQNLRATQLLRHEHELCRTKSHFKQIYGTTPATRDHPLISNLGAGKTSSNLIRVDQKKIAETITNTFLAQTDNFRNRTPVWEKYCLQTFPKELHCLYKIHTYHKWTRARSEMPPARPNIWSK